MAKRQETIEMFQEFVKDVESRPIYKQFRAFGVGLATVDGEGNYLDTFFPVVNYEENHGSAAAISFMAGWSHGSGSCELSSKDVENMLDCFAAFENDGKYHANIEVLKMLRNHQGENRQKVVAAFVACTEDDMGPQGVPDIYLRLGLLTHRKVLPNEIGVSPGAIMPKLPNVAWTSEGPMTPAEANKRLFSSRLEGKPLRIFNVDKLPHALDYYIPSGVRVADAARVRLGAHMGEGTTVMPSGFINFNAGTKGESMIEGRVSQGVTVGDKSDIGGGASIQGTMSGGSKVVVSIGERTLLGALAGTGIPLGDDCIVAAGTYIMPTTDVQLVKDDGECVPMKAHELSGENGLLFLRLGDGTIEARPNKKAVELNPILHANQ